MKAKSAGSKMKKDFEKIKRKVGQRKVTRNETDPSSVSTKRVAIPLQKFDTSDILTEALQGLRHYSDKKRIEAINILSKQGPGGITIDRLGEVLNHLGYCLSDEDASVRRKCSKLLLGILTETEDKLLGPFLNGIWLHLRAGLANVNASIRIDSIICLKALLGEIKIGSDSEVLGLLKALIELNSTVLTSELIRQASGRVSGGDFRYILWDCVEQLLENLKGNQDQVREGIIESSEWTIESLLKQTSNKTSFSGEVFKLLDSLDRSGEQDIRERMAKLAETIGLIEKQLFASSTVGLRKISAKTAGKKTKSAFSQLSALMNSDSD